MNLLFTVHHDTPKILLYFYETPMPPTPPLFFQTDLEIGVCIKGRAIHSNEACYAALSHWLNPGNRGSLFNSP